MRAPLLLVAITLFVSACGGGGSPAPTPTDPNQFFSLISFNSTTVGTVYTTQLTGSDSNGTSYSGRISMANRDQEMFEGVLVTPREAFLSLISNGNTTTVSTYGYVDTTGLFVALIVPFQLSQPVAFICLPVSPDRFPSTVKIGDFGTRSQLVCSNNQILSMTWIVEDAGNGKIDFITRSIVTGDLNQVLSTVVVTYTINSTGSIVGFRTDTELQPSGFQLNYEST